MSKIIENNKLIAQFLGFGSEKNNHYRVIIKNVVKSYLPPQHMMFENSWDWLMPVVQKITSLSSFNDDYEDNDRFWEKYNQIDINEIYEEVVKFIKWFNSQYK